MKISFTEAVKADSDLAPPPSPESALQGSETKQELDPNAQELPEPEESDDISDDSFDDDIGGFDPNNPDGQEQTPKLPITVATEYIYKLKDIKTNLDRLSTIAFNISIELNKESLEKKNFIETQIAEAISLYDIMAEGIKELPDKIPELIKLFNAIIDKIYQELKKIKLDYGVNKNKQKNQKTDSDKNKKDK